jgi:hypothetical protein
MGTCGWCRAWWRKGNNVPHAKSDDLPRANSVVYFKDDLSVPLLRVTDESSNLLMEADVINEYLQRHCNKSEVGYFIGDSIVHESAVHTPTALTPLSSPWTK